ncbi:thioesterase II family protein [Streptomyces sp. NPDC058807]|uniref:thioesterase II family protein n=1 Tax=unclassified Streptomyces TaxID=2593676 RepID=UPI0036CED814
MNTGPFVRPRRVTAPPVRLVVIPHAGASGVAYHSLGRGLPETWDLLLLDLPGRGRRHTRPALENMADVVALVTDDVAAWADGTPLALFGHSLGGAVAFEVARELERRGLPPVWTGVSGRVAPDRRAAPGRLRPELPDEELMAELAAMGGLPQRIHELPDFQDRFLGVLRSDLRVLADYRPAPARPPLNGPLTVFGGTEDPLAPPYALEGWARLTRGDHRRILCRGGHFHFLGPAFEPFARTLAQEIQRALRASDLAREPVPEAG